MSSVHVARQGFITKSALPSVSRARGSTTVADNKTVLLLNGNGTNGAQNNTFVDASTNNFTITRNGNATQGSFSPFTLPDGQWSNFFDGTGDYVTLPSGSAFQFGTGDFTIESWVYINATPTFEYILDARNSGQQTTWAFAFGLGTSGRLGFYNGTATILEEASVSVTPHTWTHCAVARSGTTISLFINGTRIATTTDTTNYSVSPTISYIGARFSAVGSMNGYLSNVRTVKGTAVYNPTLTTLTVPTTSLTAISGTSLLTCQSNRFRDNSSNNFAITRNGDVRVTSWSPFVPTSAYDPATNGGSGYFDGTGDSVRTPTSAAVLGTNNWTFECWVYLNAKPSFGQVLGMRKGVATSADQYAPVVLTINSTGFLLYSSSNSSSWNVANGTTFGGTANTNEWYHVAVVRDGSTIYGFLNGVRTTLVTGVSADYTSTNSIFVGGAESADAVNCYVSNARVVNGTAVYTSAFTPPTAPVTNITNTSLLLNFTNAGIFDTAGDNVLETVADAQIDTTTKKFGSGSLEFDGTGDWLLMPNTPNQQLSTSNFTVELWVYLATGDTGSARGLIAKGTSTTGWLVSLDSSQKIVFTYTTSTITSSGAINLDAWNHIAVVRQGTGSNQTKIYINGTNDGTGTVSTDFNQTSVMYVGANRTGGDPMKGFIDDLRVTKGFARYTATFTPPISELIVYGTSDNIVNNSTYGVYQLA